MALSQVGDSLPMEVVAERQAMEEWARKAGYRGCPNPAFGDEWCPPWTVSQAVLADRQLYDGYQDLLERSDTFTLSWNPIRAIDIDPEPGHDPQARAVEEDDGSMSATAGDRISSGSGPQSDATTTTPASSTRKRGQRGVRRFKVVKKVTIVKYITVPKNVKVIVRPCACQKEAS